jgi:hypothetical protein
VVPHVPKLLQRFDLWRMRRRASGFTAPTAPHFGSDGTTTFFREALRRASGLVEFGAGGSTYLAASLGLPFVSVESDAAFLQMMRDRIEGDGHMDPARQYYLHRPIGATRRWGRPLILEAPDAARLRLFDSFSDFPAEAASLPPGRIVVLIDGRFRVACALKALRALSGRDFLLLVDDYRSRGLYARIADFAGTPQMQGRMAVFQPQPVKDGAALDAAIHHASLDWR